MLSITPKFENSELEALEQQSKLVQQKLSSRETRALVIIVACWIPISIALFWNLGAEVCGGWIGFSVLYFLIVPSIFYFVHSKTALQKESDRLKKEIKLETARIKAENDRILEEKEAVAVGQINQLKSEIEGRRLEMLSIEDEIKYKRKWRDEFDDFPTILERNSKLDSLASSKIRQFTNEINDLRQQRFGLLYGLLPNKGSFRTWTNDYRNYPWLRWRLDSMMSWQPPTYAPLQGGRALEDNYDETEETADKKRFEEEFVEDEQVDSPESNPLPPIIPRETPPEPKPPRTGINGQASLFDQLSLTERPPHQRQQLPSYRPIKISETLRRRMEDQKIRIGMFGELAVMEYEVARLQPELGFGTREVRHISKTNDAAGYDIESWDGGEEIYIEVKTTVGDFWSNLFFTKNEFDKMQDLGKSYHLYRICKFNLESGQGELFIYKGSEMILDTFEFNEKMYLLSEKLH